MIGGQFGPLAPSIQQGQQLPPFLQEFMQNRAYQDSLRMGSQQVLQGQQNRLGANVGQLAGTGARAASEGYAPGGMQDMMQYLFGQAQGMRPWNAGGAPEIPGQAFERYLSHRGGEPFSGGQRAAAAGAVGAQALSPLSRVAQGAGGVAQAAGAAAPGTMGAGMMQAGAQGLGSVSQIPAAQMASQAGQLGGAALGAASVGYGAYEGLGRIGQGNQQLSDIRQIEDPRVRKKARSDFRGNATATGMTQALSGAAGGAMAFGPGGALVGAATGLPDFFQAWLAAEGAKERGELATGVGSAWHLGGAFTKSGRSTVKKIGKSLGL